MYTKVDKVSYYATVLMMALMVFGMVLFNLSPIYNNIKSGAFSGHIHENTTLDYSVYYSFPGFNPMEKFYATTIVNIYFSYCCSTVICGYDLYITLIVIQVIGHLKILRRNLIDISFQNEYPWSNNTSRPIIFNDEENRYIHNQLVSCIQHHKIIVQFTDEILDFLSPVLAFSNVFYMVSCCLLLLECSQLNPDALARFGPLTMVIFGELVQLSILFEVVASESQNIIKDMYSVAWERMNLKNQRTVCIMLIRMQSSITVTPMGICTVGVQNMASILKATCSYFAFLRSMN